jgi:CSLREA domain-containing protein
MAVLACLLAGVVFAPAAGASSSAFTDAFSTAAATTFTVNSTVDAVDASAGNGVCETAAGNGVCTLRAAIQESNANSGTDTIAFNVGGGGAVSIPIASDLPAVSDPVVIDGTTQPGFSGAPIVELAGPGTSTGIGLQLNAGSSTVRGLVVNRFSLAVLIRGGNSKVEGSYVGTDITGTTTTGYGNTQGIVIDATAGNVGNIIGGSMPANRNVIAGSGATARAGITIHSSDNMVQGNYIGTNAEGTAGLPGQYYGIEVRQGHRNLIGGSAAVESNVISGNQVVGVLLGWHIASSVTTGDTRVRGNLIGLNASGTAMIATQTGILVQRSSNDVIGGAGPGEGNTIAAGSHGIATPSSVSVSGTTIHGNRIGTDPSGTTVMPTNAGISLTDSATSFVIGGTTGTTPGGPCTGACNLVVANFGVLLRGVGTTVQGNFVGVDRTGTTALGNSNSTAFHVNGSQHVIGGTTPAARNVAGTHVSIFGTSNVFQGNYVGIKADGSAALTGTPAGTQNVSVTGANVVGGTTGVTPGGPCTGACNVISGVSIGVVTGGTGSVVQGNFIGTTPYGTAAIRNQIGVWAQGSDAVIGGTTSPERNVISGNNTVGVLIQPPTNGTALRNKVQGNYIGTTADGSAPLPNGINANDSTGAVHVYSAAADNEIGGSAAAGNLIAHNAKNGVYLDATAGGGNRVTHNAIRSNGRFGIEIAPDGSNANDAGDLDTGPNDRQNYPVLTSALVSAVQTDVEGTLNSEPSKTYTIDFYASRECDSQGGFGEGDAHIGSTTVTTDASGDATFAVTLAAPPQPEQQTITATATGPAGSTSEFSRCLTRSYARPKSASPVRVALVPAYATCSAPNRVHGPPLEHPSCAPPALRSATLTVGSPDANGKTAAMTGYVRYTAVVGNPATPADEADVKLSASMTDVRRRSDLSDYTGELQARTALRITDKSNGAAAVEDGTVNDIMHSWTIPCAPTAGSEGAACSINTTADALVPGTVRETRRTIWQLGQTEIYDGGTDEDVDTGPNTLFAVQGVFVP